MVWKLMHDLRAQGSTPPLDARIAALAGRQHGVVSARQLNALGVERGALAHRLKTGRLHRIHRGTYAVGHPILSLKGQFMAVALAAGVGAAISHAAAAYLHGLLAFIATRIDVSSPRRLKATTRIRSHQTRTMQARDVTTVEGIPVTTVARTLLDLSATAPQRHLERALDQAEILRVLDLRALDEQIARANGRATKRLIAALDRHRDGRTLTRSQLEEAFLAIIDDAGLPRPRINTQVCGFEVDAYWPERRLVVEVDSYRYHRSRRSFESDRRRDIAIQAAGIRAARITDRRIQHEPKAVTEDLRRLVDSVPPHPS
jgi:predicted transcriptional regulator of viral defense system